MNKANLLIAAAFAVAITLFAGSDAIAKVASDCCAAFAACCNPDSDCCP